MINVFVFKKYAAVMIGGIVCVPAFYVGLLYYGIFGGIGFFMAGLLMTVLVGPIFLKNPFSDLLEGKGILVFDLNSTGIMRPFIMSVNNPFMEGKINNKKVRDVFDRSAVLQISKPNVVKVKKSKDPNVLQDNVAHITEEGGLKINLTEEEYNKGRFALFHYPVLLYNSAINSIVTKDMLSENEKNTFAEHGVLYLTRVLEELTTLIREFGRYVVDNLKPKSNFFQSPLFFIILIVGVVLLIILFLPQIMNVLGGTVSTASEATSMAIPNANTFAP